MKPLCSFANHTYAVLDYQVGYHLDSYQVAAHFKVPQIFLNPIGLIN